MKKELIVMLGAAVLGTVCFSNMTADKVSAKTSGDYRYVVTGKKQKTCAIRKYTGKDKDVTVPEKLDGYTVTRIGNSAFTGNKKIQSIKLPKHITMIGEKSFYRCTNLKGISFSSKLHTIKKSAFDSCKNLNSVKLPDSLKKIGKNAFSNCKKLESINIPENLGETDLDLVFERDSLKKITVAEGNKLYDSRDNCNAVIETASDKLVFGTNNSIIPNSVKIIGNGAFYDCSINEITIPASVSKIEAYAFEDCKDMEKINFSEGLKIIEDEAFIGCSSLKEIKFPETLEEVGNDAFKECEKVNSIYIPKNLNDIDMVLAFEPGSLTKITVSEDNKTFDSRNNCNAIIETASNKLILGTSTSTIPDSVSVIGSEAFCNCSELKEITIPASVKTIEDSAFYDCTGLEKVNFSEGLTQIGDDAFWGCSSLKKLDLPDSLETIGENAFYRCENVTSVCIPKNLAKTELPLIFECESLSKISVADGNKNYDSRNNCNAVIETASNTLVLACKDTVIPNTVKVIGAFAYYNAPSNIVIPEGVEKILNYAFNADNTIKTITIPVSVKEIGFNSFDYGLETINYRGSKAQWDKIKTVYEEYEEDDERYDNDKPLDGVKINYNYKG